MWVYSYGLMKAFNSVCNFSKAKFTHVPGQSAPISSAPTGIRPLSQNIYHLVHLLCSSEGKKKASEIMHFYNGVSTVKKIKLGHNAQWASGKRVLPSWFMCSNPFARKQICQDGREEISKKSEVEWEGVILRRARVTAKGMVGRASRELSQEKKQTAGKWAAAQGGAGATPAVSPAGEWKTRRSP